MGGFLVTAADLANSVSAARPRYGWFSGGLWRRPTVPDNARIQENVATLAWFYAQERTWNLYYQSPELLVRLYASVSYYLGLQQEDGSFPDATGKSNAAVVGFALVYLAQTLLLMQGTGWDADLQARLKSSLRRASEWFLNPQNDAVWASAVYTSNQVAAGLLGIALCGPSITQAERVDLTEQIPVFLAKSSSPVGYLYENRSIDFGYSTTVTLGELAQLHAYTDHPDLTTAAQRYFEFCSYNYLWEPDGSGHVINGAIGTRIPAQFLDAERPDDTSNTDMLALWVPDVPLSAAFVSSSEGKDRLRRAWASDPTRPKLLTEVNPARLRTALASLTFPSAADREIALQSFRYRTESNFVEQRHDPSFDQTFLYVRRPTYYAGASWGTQHGAQQRLGLGFLYHPSTGTFVSSQPLPGLAWGCTWAGFVEGATDLTGTRVDDGGVVELDLVTANRPAYRRQIQWAADRIEVQVAGEDGLTEHLPLVFAATDQVSWITRTGIEPATIGIEESRTCRGIQVQRGSDVFEIAHAEQIVTLRAQSGSLFNPSSRQLCRLDLAGPARSVAYTLRINA